MTALLPFYVLGTGPRACCQIGSCSTWVCSLSGPRWFLTSAVTFQSQGSSSSWYASSPGACWADNDALCSLEWARGTSFSLPNNSPRGMLLLDLAFQFFGKKENNKGEDELRFFYIFTENDHGWETFPSQWGSCGALQSSCSSNQPNWTPPVLSQGPLQRLARWLFFAMVTDGCAKCIGPLACYPFLSH